MISQKMKNMVGLSLRVNIGGLAKVEEIFDQANQFGVWNWRILGHLQQFVKNKEGYLIFH